MIAMDQVKPRIPRGNAARARLPWRGLAMALLLLLGAMASAHAQIGGAHGRRQNNQQQTPQQSPAPTAPFLPEIWPRLEEGALICKSRDDLVRYQTQIANGSRERSVDWSLWPVSRCWHCHFPRIQNRQKNLMWRSTRVLSP